MIRTASKSRGFTSPTSVSPQFPKLAVLPLLVLLFLTAPMYGQGKSGKEGGDTSASYQIYSLETGITGYEASAYAISETGLVVGSISDPDSSDGAAACWTFTVGKRSFDSQITILAGGPAAAYGVNELDEIVGAGPDAALYWPSPAADPIALSGLDQATFHNAVAISNQGLIAGNAFLSGGGRAALVWCVTGEGISAPLTLPLPANGSESWPYDYDHVRTVAIRDLENGDTEIAGVANDQPVIWTLAKDSSDVLSVIGTSVLAESGSANDISPSGLVCGSTAENRAVVWTDSETLVLSPSSKFFSESTRAVNSNGVVIGSAVDNFLTIQAVVWPDPSSDPVPLDKFLRKSDLTDITTAWDVNDLGIIVGRGFDGGAQLGKAFVALPD